MLRFSFFLAACCLAACGPKPAPPQPAVKPMPTFTGTVGQLDEGGAFIQFLSSHEAQVVGLDVLFPAAAFDGGQDGDVDFFVVWEDCDALPAGQKPSGTYCAGFEYSVRNLLGAPRALNQEDAGWRLRGSFRVGKATGPLQGKMAVPLEPVQIPGRGPLPR